MIAVTIFTPLISVVRDKCHTTWVSLALLPHSSFLPFPLLTNPLAVCVILIPPNSHSLPCRPNPPGELPLDLFFFWKKASFLLICAPGDVGLDASGEEDLAPSDMCLQTGGGECWSSTGEVCVRFRPGGVWAAMVAVVAVDRAGGGGRGDLEREREMEKGRLSE